MQEFFQTDKPAPIASNALDFLAGGGEMGALMRKKDWTQTPLGPVEQWPQSLRTGVSIMLNSGHPMFLAWGPDLVFLFNDAYRPILGAKLPQALGRPFEQLWSDIWHDIKPLVDSALAGQAIWAEDRLLMMERNGYSEETYFTFSYSPIRDERGGITGVFCACTETTGKVMANRQRDQAEDALRRSQELLRESNERLNTVINQASVGISQTDTEGRLLLANDRYCEIVGRRREEVLGLSIHELTHPDDARANAAVFARLLQSGEPAFIEKRYLRPDGSTIWVNNHIALTYDAQGAPQYVIAVVQDISQRKDYELRLKHLATHDTLTGLPNRNLLHDRLRHAMESANRLGQQLGILFLDLNRFKMVNDSLGHDQGDVLLRILAQRFRTALRPGDTCARLGGDEFVMILEGISSIETIATVADQLLNIIEQPVRLDGHEVSVSTSIGISVYPKDGNDVATLLKNADTAMYEAKELGSGTFRFYSPEMNVKVLERLLTENSLRRALEKGEFEVLYQPRVSIATRQIVGIEALVRWNHPEKGLISPVDFIPLAEEIGLIEAIGTGVLKAACQQNRAWQMAGLPAVKIAVNVSPRQLSSSSLPAIIAETLAETGLDARWLELEITETGLMQNLESAHATLETIRQTGVCISIDDFGTGYSSLSYLKRLPIDTLKIDKSFIQDIPHDNDDASIVTATIAMAQNMNLKVVAEGVVSEQQLRFLANHQCEEMQGYLFSRPLPADELEALLKSNTPAQDSASRAR